MYTFKYEKNNEGNCITVCPYVVGGHVMIGSKFCQMCPNNYSFDKEKQIVVCGDKDEQQKNHEQKKKTDDRKSLLIRYRIDDKGYVYFVDPCCDEIPALLFGKLMQAIADVEKEWNTRRENKLSV